MHDKPPVNPDIEALLAELRAKKKHVQQDKEEKRAQDKREAYATLTHIVALRNNKSFQWLKDQYAKEEAKHLKKLENASDVELVEARAKWSTWKKAGALLEQLAEENAGKYRQA